MVDSSDRERPVCGEALADRGVRRRVGEFDRFADPQARQVGINRPEARCSTAGGPGLSFEIRLIEDTCEAEMPGDATKPAVHEDRQHVSSPLHWLGFNEKRLTVAGRTIGERTHDRCGSNLGDPGWDLSVDGSSEPGGSPTEPASIQPSQSSQRHSRRGAAHVDE